jgi:hypothetical protein
MVRQVIYSIIDLAAQVSALVSMAHRLSTKAGRPVGQPHVYTPARGGRYTQASHFAGPWCTPSSEGRVDVDWQLRPEITLPHGYFLSKPQTPNYLSPSHLISVSQYKSIYRTKDKGSVQITTTFRESCIPAAHFLRLLDLQIRK